jgi:hypothetical protein
VKLKLPSFWTVTHFAADWALFVAISIYGGPLWLQLLTGVMLAWHHIRGYKEGLERGFDISKKMIAILLTSLLVQLGGCGGGSEPIDRRTIEPVQCTPHQGGGCQ